MSSGRRRAARSLSDSVAAVGLGPDDRDEPIERTLVQKRRLVTDPRGVTGGLRGAVESI
ncbi:MAG: hypothetical protein ABEJ81_08895 [Haloferacaceae archaeon]